MTGYGALLSRLNIIEDQPLEARAEHLTQFDDELRACVVAGRHPSDRLTALSGVRLPARW